MRNHYLGKFPEKQSSSSAWVRNPSHHVQLAICVTDVEVSDLICSVIARPSHISSPNISMVSFLVAFLLLCFEDSNTVTLSLIGSLSGVITVLVAWCIWTSWENHPVSDAQPSEKSLSFEENDDLEERPKKFTFEVVMPEPTPEHQFSVLGLQLPLSFDWPSFLHRRRQSYDSNGTVVENP
jgi:hypothetical protein